MPGLNWKYEAGAAAALRFWQGMKEHYQMEGAAAPEGAPCPYPRTSFAGLHWQRGAASREVAHG